MGESTAMRNHEEATVHRVVKESFETLCNDRVQRCLDSRLLPPRVIRCTTMRPMGMPSSGILSVYDYEERISDDSDRRCIVPRVQHRPDNQDVYQRTIVTWRTGIDYIS